MFFILFLGTLLFQSCSNKRDILFSAYDEFHSIILYKMKNDFELLYNGLNTATGKYSLVGDTIMLTYSENQFKEFDANEKLTRKILIDTKMKRVNSIDNNMEFCAHINIDNRIKK